VRIAKRRISLNINIIKINLCILLRRHYARIDKTEFANNDYLIRDTYSVASAEGDLKASSTRIYPIKYGEISPIIIPIEGYRINIIRKPN
jgi:hypothetical protein